MKPNMAADKESCKVACGESFSVQLLDASNTHKFKKVEVKDPSLVLQTTNMSSAVVGECTFFAKHPGKTTLTLTVQQAE